ncbi:hypothetical protein MOMA_06916 [Moraxella macacae 0408225]|uniref:DNA-directed RNA polymerase C-terminal domain-containing protein n=1 Tax=Moraxella macacae 0408225 TaxID=1230338 RepID=L2F740_9GAMM|nr:DNA-directed RNA polymerase [Moraxella macacae]ELA08273.1 hypothetical protein MOMA_06916 [Moraxella macacae 0408225]
MQHFNPMQYLAIDIANHFGLDKQTYDQRIDWVKANLDDLESYQDKAEEPILFAKSVKALRDSQLGIKTGHTVALDSVNSGLQLMSVIMRCKRGCELTGLIDQDTRSDAYTAITERMNALLKQDGIDEITVTRKQAKDACMTWAYGSKAVPKRVFGELVNYFYLAIENEFKGALELKDILQDSWNKYALSHSWFMPDNHYVFVPVMEKSYKRYKITEINYMPTVIVNENIGTDFGISNIANAIHSIDAYVLRTLVRYCNYHKGKIKHFMSLVDNVVYKDVVINDDIQRYKNTGIADISFINNINEDNIKHYPVELINQLYNKCLMLLEHEPFELITIHDSFACSPIHCNRLRHYYNVILAELSNSTVIDDICNQLFGDIATIKKGGAIYNEILNSNYALS